MIDDDVEVADDSSRDANTQQGRLDHRLSERKKDTQQEMKD
jgi:hypothetical protein